MEDNKDNNFENPVYSSIYSPKPKSSLRGLKFDYKNYFNNMGQTKILNKKVLGLAGAALILLIVIFAITASGNTNNSAVKGESKVEISDPKATQDLNREFTFPIKNEKGEEISKIKYIVEKVEKKDEIVVKGQKAESVAGRTFLIVNLKIVNEHTQPIQMNTRDYVRITVNDKMNEMLAPDIHNDPVEIQAISTKFTRVGLPINDSDQNIKLHIGEILGEKSIIDVTI